MTYPSATHRRVAAVLSRAARSFVNQAPDDGIVALADPLDRDTIRATAEHHRVTPVLSAAFSLAGAQGWLGAGVASEQPLTLARHTRTLHEAGWVCTVLETAGVGCAVVKGPVVAELAYGRPDLRIYADLDVLVHPKDFRRAVEALTDAGALLLDNNWVLAGQQVRGELSLMLPQGTPLDLHWHLVNDAGSRDTLRWPTGPLLDRRARDEQFHGLPRLNDLDAAHHLAVHSVLSGGHLLQWHLDSALWLTRRQVRVADLRKLAEETKTGLIVDLMVQRVGLLLGGGWDAENPHSAWTRLISLADRWAPPGRPPGSSPTWRSMVSSTRGDVLATTRAAVRSGARSVVAAPSRRLGLGERSRTEVNPLQIPRGGPRERDDYFSAVARHD